MPRSLRHRRSRLHVSVTDLASNSRPAFLILMRSNRFLFLVGVVSGLALGNLRSVEAAPETPKKPVSTKYQDVTVEDPYQWLEEDNDPQVKSWSDAQNHRTRQYVDKLPDRAAIAKQLTEWYAKTSPSYSSLVSRPGILFAMIFQPPKQQPLLVTLASADDLKSEKIVLDPNVLDSKGTTAIDWFVPSLDGRRVAVSLSKGGSEDGTLHFYDTATSKALPDTIAHVQYPTAGGSAAWNADGTGIYYTRFPGKGERPEADLNFYQQVYFHKLGTPDTEDTYSIGKVLRLPLETPELSKAVEIVPTGEPVIQQIVPTADALFVGDLLGGPSQIRRFGLDGKGETIIPIPKISAVQEMVALEDGSLLFRDQSYTEPAAWFRCAKEKTEPVKTALRTTSPVSFADIEVTREFATSKDGTKIPLNIIFRKGM